MKKNAALIELILSIVIFAFAALLLLRVMAYADRLNKDSSDELKATLEMQSLVEQLRSDSDELALIYENNGFTAYYDAGFLPCSESEAESYINIYVEPEENAAGCLYELTLLAAKDGGRRIAELSAAVYVPSVGGAQ